MTLEAKKKGPINQNLQQKASYLANKATEQFLEQADKNTIKGLYENLIQIAELNTERSHENEPHRPEIQCRAGCSHCCHMRVLVTPVEVLHLADHIKTTYSVTDLGELIGRLSSAIEQSKDLSDFEYGLKKIRCPLLEGDDCSVYEFRPLECRGYVSFDVEACKTAAQDYNKWNVPIWLSQFSIFKNVQSGMTTTLAANDYEHDLLEFLSALKIALELNDASQKWLEGEKIFATARLDNDDPNVTALLPWTKPKEE